MKTKGFEKMFNELAGYEKQVSEMREQIKNVIRSAIENVADDCDVFGKAKPVGDNSVSCSTVSYRNLVGKPWTLHRYDKKRAISALMIYLDKFPVNEWVSEIQNFKKKIRPDGDFQFTVNGVKYIIAGEFVDAVVDAFDD